MWYRSIMLFGFACAASLWVRHFSAELRTAFGSIWRRGEQMADRSEARCHRIMAMVASLFGMLGFLLAVAIDAWIASKGPTEGVRMSASVGVRLLLFPLAMALFGLAYGAAISGLFAPRWFLYGDLGRRWTRLVGTKNVVVAKIVCLLIASVPLWVFLLVRYG
jgi:hypothetical protein